jgi:hypothetical protein
MEAANRRWRVNGRGPGVRTRGSSSGGDPGRPPGQRPQRANPATALPSTLVRANVEKQRLKKYSMRAYLYISSGTKVEYFGLEASLD